MTKTIELREQFLSIKADYDILKTSKLEKLKQLIDDITMLKFETDKSFKNATYTAKEYQMLKTIDKNLQEVFNTTCKEHADLYTKLKQNE